MAGGSLPVLARSYEKPRGRSGLNYPRWSSLRNHVRTFRRTWETFAGKCERRRCILRARRSRYSSASGDK